MSLPEMFAELASRIAAVDRIVPRQQWATVVTTSPLSVVMDTDPSATPHPVTDSLVPGVQVGHRVEVRTVKSRLTITASLGGDTGWIEITTPSGWVAQRTIAIRRVGYQISVRGRITPGSPKAGTVTVLPAGAVPAWARPASIFDTMRPLSSEHSSGTAERAIKSGAIGPDGSVTVWYGPSNSDPINLAGLSGYFTEAVVAAAPRMPRRILMIGDSLTVGRGAGTGPLGMVGARAGSPASILSRKFSSMGQSTTADSIVGMGGNESAATTEEYDPRISLGNWGMLEFPGAIGGDIFFADDSSAGTLRFSFEDVDSIVLGLPNRTAGGYGSIRYRLDGGAWVTHNEGVAPEPGLLERMYVLNGGALGNHVLEVESVEPTANTYVQYCEAWNSHKRTALIPWGERGATSADMLTDNRPWGVRAALGHVPYDAAIVCIGMNDVSTSVPAATYRANLTTLIGALRTQRPGCPVALVIPLERSGGLDHLPDSITAVGANTGCTVIDLRDAPGLSTYDEAVASNAMDDLVHPNAYGYRTAWEHAAPALYMALDA